VEKVLKIKDKLIRLEIWDTAGQKRFRSIERIFYNEANAVVLVYDITNDLSFKKIQNYWYDQILESNSKDINNYIFLNYFFIY